MRSLLYLTYLLLGPYYQLAFFIPGNCPLRANSLKQILHIPNFLINDLGLPQSSHLLCCLTLKCFSLLCLAIIDFFAILFFFLERHPYHTQECLALVLLSIVSNKSNLQTSDPFDNIRIYFRKYCMLGYTD